MYVKFAGITLLCLTTMALADPVSKTLGEFSGVWDSTPYELTVTVSTEYGYTIDGPSDAVSSFSASIDSNGILKLSRTGSGSSSTKVTVRIPAGKLKSFQVSGSGNKRVDGAAATDSFTYRSSGSGSIQITNLVSTSVTAEVSGSGKHLITSTSDAKLTKFDYKGSGSQTFYLGGLSGTASLQLSGSGDLYVAATDSGKITGTYWGSGKIYYDKGSCSVSGSGKCVQQSVTIPDSI